MSLLVQAFVTPIKFDKHGTARCDHVAVFDCGTIKLCKDRRADAARFHMHGWQWVQVARVPAGCEFIGNYPALM